MDALRKHDRWMDYRQIAIVSTAGAVEAHTGPGTKGWSGHLVQGGLVVLGNGLPDPAPLHALFDRFQAQAGSATPAQSDGFSRPMRTLASGDKGVAPVPSKVGQLSSCCALMPVISGYWPTSTMASIGTAIGRVR